jgi:hypothetical protein
MQTSKLILVLGIIFIVSGCSSHRQEKESNSTADSTEAYISSSAAVENKKDTTHKFIRTADLKFKVKNVIQTTYKIEDITSRQGGFVTKTNLTSTLDNVTTTAISADSSLETTHFTVINSMTIRVPNTKLDTTLKSIAKLIDFLDYRIIAAEDVAIQILSNNLTQKRVAKNEERLINAIDNRGKKLQETTVAEESLFGKQEQADNAKISNLSLKDQINFSTINLNLYQRQTVKRELIFNEKNTEQYEPGFGKKILDAFKSGWSILATFIVFITQLWGLILFGLIIYFIYRKYGHKLNK